MPNDKDRIARRIETEIKGIEHGLRRTGLSNDDVIRRRIAAIRQALRTRELDTAILLSNLLPQLVSNRQSEQRRQAAQEHIHGTWPRNKR